VIDKRIWLLISAYLLFFILVPPFQIPDEPGHYENIHWLSRLKYPKLPLADIKNPRLYVQRIADAYDTEAVNNNPFILPGFQKAKVLNTGRKDNLQKLDPVSSQAHHPPLYYFFGAVVYKLTQTINVNQILQIYLLRMISSLFYFGSIIAAYQILKKLFKDKNTVFNLLVFVFINPLMLQIGVGINNDIAVIFFSLVFLLFLLRYEGKNIFFLALISALAVLSKFSGIFTAFAFTGVTLFKEKRIKTSLAAVMKYSLMLMVLLSPWFFFNYQRYQKIIIDNFYIYSDKLTLNLSFTQALAQAVLEFRHTIMHYAGFVGWYQTYPFKWFFILYAALFVLLAFIGLIKALRGKNNRSGVLLIYSFSLMLFLFLLSLRHKLLGYSWDIQGKYLAPAFLPLAIFLLTGAGHVFKTKPENASRWFLYFSVFHFNFILFFVLIPKYYV
jgi:hypothetical protein